MTAPDYETIYAYEDAIEAAFKAAFIASGITNVYTSRDGDEVETPYVTVQFTPGGATGHYAHLPNGTQRFDMFNGQSSIGFVTNRGKNAASHSAFKAKVRNKFDDPLFLERLNSELLYLTIQWLQEGGTTPMARSEDNEDTSEINFNTPFAIRPEAWPV